LKRLSFISLTILLLLILIPGCITFKAPVAAPVQPPGTSSVSSVIPVSFMVTGVTANTEPSNTSGCFTLYANITASGPGAVTYNWESADGGGYSYT